MNKGRYNNFREYFERKSDIFCLKHNGNVRVTDDEKVVFDSLESALAHRLMGWENVATVFRRYETMGEEIFLEKKCFWQNDDDLVDMPMAGGFVGGKMNPTKAMNFFADVSGKGYGTLELIFPVEKYSCFKNNARDNVFFENKREFDEEILNDFCYRDLLGFLALAPKWLVVAEREELSNAIDKNAKNALQEKMTSDPDDTKGMQEIGEEYVELKSCLCVLVNRFNEENFEIERQRQAEEIRKQEDEEILEINRQNYAESCAE